MHLEKSVSVILLAGGIGKRMNHPIPKQYLNLHHKPIARYSFELFLSLPEIAELIIVCVPDARHYFHLPESSIPILFADPGPRRQDSVWNGLQAISSSSELVCIHDSARPFIDKLLVKRVLEAGYLHGAATVGMPVKFTLKEHDGSCMVKQTLNRSHIWEIQTPQVIRIPLIKQGFHHAQKHEITVTDDVSLVELLNHPVKLVEGSHMNIKITSPEDLLVAEGLLKDFYDKTRSSLS